MAGDKPHFSAAEPSHNCLVSLNLREARSNQKGGFWIFQARNPDPIPRCATYRLQSSLAGRSAEMATDLTRLETP